MPSQGLDRYPEIFFKPDWIGDMPAIQSKPLGYIIVAVTANHLCKSRIGAVEFSIIRLFNTASIFFVRIKVVGTAEVIFRSRAAYCRVFRISVHIKFYFSFAPPSIAMYSPGEIGANILSASMNAIQQYDDRFIWQGIHAPELCMKISCVGRHFCEYIVYLVIQHHRVLVDI